MTEPKPWARRAGNVIAALILALFIVGLVTLLSWMVTNLFGS